MVLPLTEILSAQLPLDAPVAWRPDNSRIPRRQFLDATSALAARLRECPEVRWALCFEDAFLTAVATFACLAAQKQIVMPGHAQPERLREQRFFFDALLTDIPLLELENLLVIHLSNHDAEFFPEDSFQGASSLSSSVFDFSQSTVTFFTSGSTGIPKPNVKTIAQLEIENQIQAACWAGNIQNSCITGTTSPLHLYGFQFRVLLPLTCGVPFNTELVEYHEQLHAIPGPVSLVTSPAFLKRLDPKLPELRASFILSAGGFLSSAVSEQARQLLGIAPFEIFGSTEAGAIAWRDNNTECQHWTPLPGVTVSADAEGRLALRSPFLSGGEELVTDDKVQLDPVAKTFLLLGRLDRTLKIEEKRISLPEVEKVLLSLPHVADAAVVPFETQTRTILAALLVLDEAGLQEHALLGNARYLLQLRQRLRTRLEPVAIPRRLKILSAIPESAQGKRHTPTLQAFFETQPSQSPTSGLATMAPKFPHILSQTSAAKLGRESTIQLSLQLGAELLWFQGHFEKHPILPGVAQLNWAIHYAQKFLSSPGKLLRIESLKFKKPLVPGDLVILALRHTSENQRLDFVYTLDGETVSLGKLTLAP